MKPFSTPESRGWDHEEINRRVNELRSENVVIREWPHNEGAFEYQLYFHFENSIIFVRLLIEDWQDDTSDLLITNLVNTPYEERKKGNATKVIEIIVEWATKHEFNEIRATQVTDARYFWEKNHFVRLPEPNQYSDFVRKIPTTKTQ